MKLTKKFKFAWAMKPASMAVLTVLLNSYVSYYATNFMMIPVATVGIVFMISKIFDGFTDIIAGYLIDHTHTRLGKARPYELGMIGYWGCTVALYCAPELGQAGSILYLFMMYTFIQSIFYTMLTCNDTVYLANTGCSTEQAVSLSSFTGIVTMLFSLLAAVIVPQMVANMGSTRGGWRMISIILAVPMVLLGLVRFLAIKETTDNSRSSTDTLTLKDSIYLLFHNKYILLFALIMLIANIGSSLSTNVNTYYFIYIYGDIGAASFGAISLVSLIISIGFVPVISKKIGFQRTIRAIVLIGAAGFFFRLVNVHSLAVLMISLFFSSIGFTTLYMFVNVYIMGCMDYGEWKNGKRSEGTIACIHGVACKVGTALGMGISGILMGMSGFDASLAIQKAPANMMIVALTTVLPAVFCIIMYIALRFYKLDDMMPQIQQDLVERRSAAVNGGEK